MADSTFPVLPSWGRTVSHWLLTRLLGGICFFIALGWASSVYDAGHPEPPKANPDLFDGVGSGLAAGLFAVWGIEFEFCCALPLLVLLPGRVRKALAAPEAATRRKQLFANVMGWALLLPMLAAGLTALSEHELPLALGLLGLGILYAVVAGGIAWLLYARWLTTT